MTQIALLPGDGIGPEVIEGPIAYLRHLASEGLAIQLCGPFPYGASGWLETGSILPKETVEACQDADVVLSGAVGTHPGVPQANCPNPEAALIELRHIFDLRISVRTVWAPGMDDVTIVRNITGGAYASPEQRTESDGETEAVDQIRLHPARVREVLELAAKYAAAVPLRRSISVDKASVFATSRLWRRVAEQVNAQFGVVFEHVNVDRAGYELVRFEELPAVIVTEGIFGDIFTDVVCARAGSPALCGSSTINPDRVAGDGVGALFEPAHGSSPHRTGSRRSNPTGAWLALAALFDWCPDLKPFGLSARVRASLDAVYASGIRTYDLATDSDQLVDMDGFNEAVLTNLIDMPHVGGEVGKT